MFTRVRRWMSTPVIVIPARAVVGEAQRIMEERKIQHLPVVDGERVVGIVSETTVAPLLHPAANRSLHVARRRPIASDPAVAEVMTPVPAIVGPDDRAAEAARLMLERRWARC